MSIFMLWFTLDHPAGDLAAVVPVAVATLTPFPLLAALVYYRLTGTGQDRTSDVDPHQLLDPALSPDPT